MFNKYYEITLMNPEGERITEYNSTIVPIINDVIVDDKDDEELKSVSEYIVIERRFSTYNESRVVLLVKNNE